ncbi:HisG, C-terminal domain-containing protein [Mycena latifolia]|nr:HisG, C-terminal domain-containing protein [Mycena latifolia]
MPARHRDRARLGGSPHRIERPETHVSRSLIKLITRRMAGVITATKSVVYQYNILRTQLPAATEITPGRRAPTISPLEDDGWVVLSCMVEKREIATIMDRLSTIAEDIMIFNLDNYRV